MANTSASAGSSIQRNTTAFAIGAFVWLAIIAVIIVDLVWGLTHDNYSYVTDTISDLAAGSNSMTMDVAMKVFSFAIMLLSFGLYHLGREHDVSSNRWLIGCAILVPLAIAIYFIASFDAYSNDTSSRALTIHRWLTYGLAAGFPLICFLMSRGIGKFSKAFARYSQIAGVLWIITAPIFMFLPTGYDGLYERMLAAQLLIWFGGAAWLLIRQDQAT